LSYSAPEFRWLKGGGTQVGRLKAGGSQDWLPHILAVLLLGGPLFAQRGDPAAIASISIVAPANYVVAARSIQLSARTVNTRGAALRGRSVEWRVNDTARAAIDESGLFSGIAPGPVAVTATDKESGISGAYTIFIYPASVSISPGAATVQAG